MIELIFIIGIVLIISIGIYLMKSTEDFIDYKNKEIKKQILLNESFFKSQKDMNKWTKKNNNKMIKAIGKLK
tara:strand:- start:58 stop:273 length:216 start_codon:yes stop_codon:yes gene_type:complete